MYTEVEMMVRSLWSRQAAQIWLTLGIFFALVLLYIYFFAQSDRERFLQQTGLTVVPETHDSNVIYTEKGGQLYALFGNAYATQPLTNDCPNFSRVDFTTWCDISTPVSY